MRTARGRVLFASCVRKKNTNNTSQRMFLVSVSDAEPGGGARGRDGTALACVSLPVQSSDVTVDFTRSHLRHGFMGSFARVPCQEKQTLQVRRSVIRERRHKAWGDSGDDFVASWHLHLTPRTSQPPGARRGRDGLARLPVEAFRSQADAAGVRLRHPDTARCRKHLVSARAANVTSRDPSLRYCSNLEPARALELRD